MAKPTYTELLRDPRWQKKRLEILSRDLFTCQSCRDTETTLHVHHKHYHKGRMPWDYADHELVTLCEHCHEGVDEQDSRLKDVIARLPMDGPFSVSSALSVLAGYAYMSAKKSDDLLSYFEDDPHGFRVGEVAAFMSVLTADELRGVLDVMDRPHEERMAAVHAFIEQNKRK